MAWGETQFELPRAAPRRSRAPLIAAAVALVVLLAAAGTGAVLFKKHRDEPTAVATPPGDSVALPPGRKDLPPIAAVAVPGAGVEPATAEAPSSLPSGRVPTSAARDKPPKLTPAKPSKPGPAAPPPPGAKPDDLSNIGRR